MSASASIGAETCTKCKSDLPPRYGNTHSYYGFTLSSESQPGVLCSSCAKEIERRSPEAAGWKMFSFD